MISDPGKDKFIKEDRKLERLKVWKRPSNKEAQDDERAERQADWEAR